MARVQRVFTAPGDYAALLQALAQTQERYPFRLYGYCLMSDQFHPLLEPEASQNISRILQSLTVAHTLRFHRGHRSSGHVWQGRFKSPVIQDDIHMLTVLRYIESNPLRAGMVTDLADYPWCSYANHGLGHVQELVSESQLGAPNGRPVVTDRRTIDSSRAVKSVCRMRTDTIIDTIISHFPRTETKSAGKR
jgi:putative transposase